MVQDPKSESPTPSQSTETMVDIDMEIKDNMGAGKKHLLCSDYPDAVACFQEACKLLAQKYGQLSEECGDAYYYYGSSLLELSRLENGVLGNALKGVPEEEESDKDDEQFEKPNLAESDREKLREDVEAAMATEDDEEEADKKEDLGQKSGEEEKKPEEKAEEEKAPAEPEKETEEQSETPSTSKPTAPSSSKSEQSKESGEEDEENPDDIPNMQLAWEMLELARVLYKKREKSGDNSLMVAQCHLKLGELGLEGEQYPQAIGDFLECLLVQKEHLAETDRKLAETHYNLGLAYSFEKRCDNALEHYQNALNVLEARVELLEELIDSKDGQSENEVDSIAECMEVGEIKELIPDINSKIEDILSVKKQNEGKREGLPFAQTGETSTGFGAESSSSTACSTIPVRKVAPSTAKESTSDISHLVRRKRASPDEEGSATETDGDSKKAKQDDADSKKAKQEDADSKEAKQEDGDSKKAKAEESESNGHESDNNGDGSRNNSDHKNGDGSRTSPKKTEAKEGDHSAVDLTNTMAATGDATVAAAELKNTMAAAGDTPMAAADLKNPVAAADPENTMAAAGDTPVAAADLKNAMAAAGDAPVAMET